MRQGREFMRRAAMTVCGVTLLGTWTSCNVPGAKSTSLTGAVLEAAGDPRRQRPLPYADVTLTSDRGVAETKSDVSGLFRLTLPPSIRRNPSVTLKISHAGYEPFEQSGPVKDEIYVARLTPLHAEPEALPGGKVVTLRDLRVRYSVKTSATLDVGSFARTFEVAGSGGRPCRIQSSCSPDGKWEALAGSVSYDAGDGNEFHEVRISCIAGPCPFTSIEPPRLGKAGRTMKVSALDWSDTATFLVEAEVTRTQVEDVVRYAIPVVFGNGMNFALPGTAEGPSVEADVSGTEIVYPLGPSLLLSWAACTLKTDVDASKIYRCELKPGYRFQ